MELEIEGLVERLRVLAIPETNEMEDALYEAMDAITRMAGEIEGLKEQTAGFERRIDEARRGATVNGCAAVDAVQMLQDAESRSTALAAEVERLKRELGNAEGVARPALPRLETEMESKEIEGLVERLKESARDILETGMSREGGHGLMASVAKAADALTRIAGELREANNWARQMDAERSNWKRWTAEAESRSTALAAEVERLRAALESIVQWSEAYPLNIFRKPDLKRAHEVLTAAGMTLDAISADAMRHVIEGVGKISRAALTEPVKEG